MYLQDVGLNDLAFPIRAVSREDPNGQPTVAKISVKARIAQEFEARWIDRFIKVLHEHRDALGPEALRRDVPHFLDPLAAKSVQVRFDYPFFVEKTTPVSHEKCFVRFSCSYQTSASGMLHQPTVVFSIVVPAVTTYPLSAKDKHGGLFGQLSLLAIEIKSCEDVFPEDLVELVDRHALAPVYSFLSEEDQESIIERIHSREVTSVALAEAVKEELAHDRRVEWYSVTCSNYGMLHSFSTVVTTEKSQWIPFTTYGEDDI